MTWRVGMSTSLVIDASFIVRLILPGPTQVEFRTLMTQWKQNGRNLCTPTLCLYETTSAISKAVHFDLITLAEGNEALQLIKQLNIEMIHPDEIQTKHAFDWTLRLNRAAAYDSFYLALTETLKTELWTADKRLYNAVNETWIHLVGATG